MVMTPLKKPLPPHASKEPRISICNYQSICKELVLVLLLFFVFDYLLSPLLDLVEVMPLLLLSGLVKTLLLLCLMRFRRYNIATGGRLPLLRMILTFLLLFVLNALSAFLFRGQSALLFPPASGSFQVLVLFLMMAISVFFEELLYRAYLLERLQKLGASRILAMLISGLLFSTGHVYLGARGVAFALVSSFLLTRLYYRSGGIRAGFIVHLAYNLIILKFNGYW